jgi:hypothetical protein
MHSIAHTRGVYIVAAIAALITACNDGNDPSHIMEPTKGLPGVASQHTLASAGTVVQVANVEQLYAAINDPANAGSTILLAPGTYTLSARNASALARPNAGRLELQQDMSLSGVVDDRSAVVIDATALPMSSFTAPFGRTGVIRAGRGNNGVEWLTIAGNPLAAAGVETDLFSTPETNVRVAHVVAGNSARGVDIRNVGADMAGRRLHAEIVDGEFFRGVEGIRAVNFLGADHGDISVVMSGNRSYQNVVGCVIENNRTNFGTIYVRSSGDRFEDNGLGCSISGGMSQTTGPANSNSVVFEGHGTDILNNTRTIFFNNTGPTFADAGGIVAAGGTASTANSTSSNTVVVRLWGCRISGNQNIESGAFDFQVLGARSLVSGLGGTDNHAIVSLQGVSKFIDVDVVNSLPVDPSGSNTVTITR